MPGEQKRLSEELRELLEDVAAGRTTPEVATAVISRWMVHVICATSGKTVGEIVGRAQG